jgi:hypothetical protein
MEEMEEKGEKEEKEVNIRLLNCESPNNSLSVLI